MEPDGSAGDCELCGLPFTQASLEQLGRKVVANIVAVGALVEISGVLPADAVEQAVINRVPERFRELNTEAFRLGRRLAAEARDGAQS